MCEKVGILNIRFIKKIILQIDILMILYCIEEDVAFTKVR